MVTPPPVVDPEDAGVLLEDEDETADGVGVGVELEVVGARVEMDAVC